MIEQKIHQPVIELDLSPLISKELADQTAWYMATRGRGIVVIAEKPVRGFLSSRRGLTRLIAFGTERNLKVFVQLEEQFSHGHGLRKTLGEVSNDVSSMISKVQPQTL